MKRHLSLAGRKSNIFQLVGETIWVLSGSGKVTGYLETLMPRAPQYSDDGVVWRAAYGPRLFAYNQLTDVIKFFERDGKMTRRAVVSIFFPEYDTFTQLEKEGLSDSKDFSCFPAGTRVYTIRDGWKPIEDIKIGELVLSFDNNNRMTTNKVTASGMTKKVNQLCRVVLRNGESFECTPEHMIYVKNRDGSFTQKEARNLKKNDRPLSPVIRDIPSEYISLKKDPLSSNTFDNRVGLHRIVAGASDLSTKDFHVDHIDNNRRNNSPENLQILSASEHGRKTRLFDGNNTKTPEMSERRKEQSLKYPGITNGNYHKNWTRDDVVSAYLAAFRNGLFVDGLKANNGDIGLPSASAISARWFDSWSNFVSVLREDKEFDAWYSERVNWGSSRTNKAFDYIVERVEMVDVDSIPVYDITVENSHNYVIDCGTGIVVHNCNNLMYFYVTPDDRFHLKVTNRSNDSVFGQGINITEFSVIQELIFHKVRLMHPELTLGDLTISSNNFHAYDWSFDQVQAVCSIEQKPFVDFANKPLCSPGIDIGEARKMLGGFIDYCETINSESNVCFKSSGEFQIGDYVEMTERYFLQKAGAIVPPLDIRNYQEDLLDAIYNSSFRKFEVIV
jgi:hypothetical protein